MVKTPGVSRRRFVGATAAAVAAPYFVPSSALGQGGRPAPSNRLTLAMIGIGNMGGGHLGAWLGRPDVQVVACCDVRQDVRDRCRTQTEQRYASQTASGTFKGCAADNDFRAVLARDDIDLVCIATPDHWHALIAIEAAKARKDIYCEKPMTLTIREAHAMHAAMRRYNRVFQLGSQQRSSREFRLACEMVRSGRIGKVTNVNVNVGGPSGPKEFPAQPIPEGFDWDLWLGPAPWAEYNFERSSGNYGGGWRQVRDYSGGAMTDWGNHHFDIAQWGLGRDLSGPVEILPPNLTPNRKLVMRYDDGITLTHGGGGNGVLFEGTEGKVEVNRGYLKTYPESIMADPIGASEVHLYESPGHHEDFLRCVRNRQRPICDVAIGESTITVCHLGNLAWWLGRKLTWDPDQKTIVGDAEAIRMMDRPRRAPWRLDV
ncbi:MAG: Gfo/Idh/MocA family oxidoreductase [Fimbriimonadaceae bacterium]|nr:Gfo/Idh/MocA family oxidoreductase [Fimbriimonadaceae bacterium]